MHSEVFDKLKRVTETIGENYTSSQLLSVLDSLIFYALDAIIDHTSWLDLVVGNVLVWYGDNRKRKLSPLPKHQVLERCFLFVTTPSKEHKKELIRVMELERSLWFNACRLFTEGAGEALSREMPDRLRIAYMENHDGDLYVAVRDCLYWIQVAQEMKRRIMEKYMRFTVTMANAYMKGANTRIDLDDLIQNFVLAVSKAIDKCSANQGTLTSYIQQWIRSAQSSSSSSHEYGVAYSVPPAIRKQFTDNRRVPNIALPLDCDEAITKATPGPEELCENEDEIQKIRLLAKHADPSGLARLYHGIQETLDAEELSLLLSVSYCKK
jgi:hypothetical protein